MAIEKILVIDQDEKFRGFVSETLKATYELEWSENGREGSQRAASAGFDLVLASTDVPDFDAIFHAECPAGPAVIVIGGATGREQAAAFLARGAVGYAIKPVSAKELTAVINQAGRIAQLAEVCRRANGEDEEAFLGDSFASSQLRALVTKISQTNIPLLIRGEAGVGKELVARLVHRQGMRAGGPFIKVDCAAVAEDDIAQQLFGWSVWGPVGQGRRPEGVLELAAGGSVLIAELSLLPASAQSLLLKAIQEKLFQRTDGTRKLPLETRVIATTSRDIEAEVRQGKFNEQLFYALNVVPVWVPPLKERPQDVRALASSFARYYARKHGGALKSLSTEAVAAFEHASWPCNVRDLKYAVEKSILRCNTSAGSPVNVVFGASSSESGATASIQDVENLDEIEKRHILAVLARCNGNRTSAAKRLGISIRTIRNKLKIYRSVAPVEVLQEAV